MYSSAIFPTAGATLEEAALHKLELVCRKLDLGPGDHLLEIGTGWGGLAVHAAAHYGCRVTTTTISREQHDHAVARVRAAGLEDRVTVLLRDYRELEGSYDKLVSIEMIEAVGWKDFGTFFARCSDLLAPHGLMLLQAITIDDRAYHVEKGNRSFIATYIFPGGCLPSSEIIARCVARRTDLHAVGLQDITADYAETLRHWRRRFLGAAGRGRGAGLRRALPAPVEPLPRLLRGGLPRAAHPRRAAAAGQAALARRHPGAGRRAACADEARGARSCLSWAPTSAARARRCCSCTASAAPAGSGIPWSRRWPPTYEVIAVDLPGFGESRAARGRRDARPAHAGARPRRAASTRAGSRPRTSPAARWAPGSRWSSRAWAARAR